MRRHVSDVSPRTDLESTLLCVGTFFVLWLTYRHFVAFLNYFLVEDKIRDDTVETIMCRRVPSSLAFQRTILKSWEWPGDEASARAQIVRVNIDSRDKMTSTIATPNRLGLQFQLTIQRAKIAGPMP